MAIPKIIHYCWFGKKPFSSLALNCIYSWREYCPGYKFSLWNEKNIDINSNAFMKEAYEMEKWAFVSDYVRLFVLYHIGGVYLDTDVQLLKVFEPILKNKSAVTGYQEDIFVPAAFMAFEPKNIWIKHLLDYYNNKHFIKEDGTLDIKTNSEIITEISCRDFNLKIGDNYISKGNVELLPSVYFAPYKKSTLHTKKNLEQLYKIDKDLTYAIHHASGSWTSQNKKVKTKMLILGILRLLLGERLYTRIKSHLWRRKIHLVSRR